MAESRSSKSLEYEGEVLSLIKSEKVWDVLGDDRVRIGLEGDVHHAEEETAPITGKTLSETSNTQVLARPTAEDRIGTARREGHDIVVKPAFRKSATQNHVTLRVQFAKHVRRHGRGLKSANTTKKAYGPH